MRTPDETTIAKVRGWRARNPPVSWQNCSAMTGYSAEDLRRLCDVLVVAVASPSASQRPPVVRRLEPDATAPSLPTARQKEAARIAQRHSALLCAAAQLPEEFAAAELTGLAGENGHAVGQMLRCFARRKLATNRRAGDGSRRWRLTADGLALAVRWNGGVAPPKVEVETGETPYDMLLEALAVAARRAVTRHGVAAEELARFCGMTTKAASARLAALRRRGLTEAVPGSGGLLLWRMPGKGAADDALPAAPPSPLQSRALERAARLPQPFRAQALADRTGLSPMTLGQLLRALAVRGWTEGTRAAGGCLWRVTDAGRAAVVGQAGPEAVAA